MKVKIFLRLAGDTALLLILFLLWWHLQLCMYLLSQTSGQIKVLAARQSISSYINQHELTDQEKENLNLIEKIKKFSVDSLNYLPTDNYETIYDSKQDAVLWLITASKPFELKPVEWDFPIIGKVSYKGFFNKTLAMQEQIKLMNKGYDVQLSKVSAWSTLGWFKDPIISTMLKQPKAMFCHLLFHELFHSTYFEAGKVNLNENMAEFVAEKATFKFLKMDTIALNQYRKWLNFSAAKDNFKRHCVNYLDSFYKKMPSHAAKYKIKNEAIKKCVNNLSQLKFLDSTAYFVIEKNILVSQNAYFIGFLQYNSLHDSLEEVFNKIYKGRIENLVRDLKPN